MPQTQLLLYLIQPLSQQYILLCLLRHASTGLFNSRHADAETFPDISQTVPAVAVTQMNRNLTRHDVIIEPLLNRSNYLVHGALSKKRFVRWQIAISARLFNMLPTNTVQRYSPAPTPYRRQPFSKAFRSLR